LLENPAKSYTPRIAPPVSAIPGLEILPTPALVESITYRYHRRTERLETPAKSPNRELLSPPDSPIQIQSNNFIIAKEFTVEDSIREVNLRVDVTCQTCTGQELVILMLNENDFQKFKRGHLSPPEDRGNRILNFTYYGKLKEGRYYAVLYNPSNRNVLIHYQTDLSFVAQQ
jgi:hypothetical protein